ncbi:hypothetical protein B0H17DRAFT_1197088 [Mycena rosella]|uniref:Uncharacterized protein n=1 Tax=Mycena rosella TaxID=1033263 RepID=A0AAD7DSH3_MYCRO|nr:hypothetical protein B0H17DRAFT_1197088 [Mycena rosella]
MLPVITRILALAAFATKFTAAAPALVTFMAPFPGDSTTTLTAQILGIDSNGRTTYALEQNEMQGSTVLASAILVKFTLRSADTGPLDGPITLTLGIECVLTNAICSDDKHKSTTDDTTKTATTLNDTNDDHKKTTTHLDDDARSRTVGTSDVHHVQIPYSNLPAPTCNNLEDHLKTGTTDDNMATVSSLGFWVPNIVSTAPPSGSTATPIAGRTGSAPTSASEH